MTAVLGVPLPDGEPDDAAFGAGEGLGAGEADFLPCTGAITKVTEERGPLTGR